MVSYGIDTGGTITGSGFSGMVSYVSLIAGVGISGSASAAGFERPHKTTVMNARKSSVAMMCGNLL